MNSDWSQNRPECWLWGRACMSEKRDFLKFQLQVAYLCNLRFFANKFVCTVLTDLLSRFGWKLIYMYVIQWCMSEIIDFFKITLSAWPRYEGQLTRMAEPTPLPVSPPRTHSRLCHHPDLRTNGRWRIWTERRGRCVAHHFYTV